MDLQATMTQSHLIDIVLSLGLDLREEFNSIKGACPVHGGDNPNALTIYPNSEKWFCWSHHCEATFGCSIKGLLRGIISHKLHNWQNEGNQECTHFEYVTFLKDVNILNPIKRDKIEVVSRQNSLKIYPNRFKELVKIPSAYYITRGYSKDILNKFDIGECFIPNKSMFQRAVTPIYDDDKQFVIGYTGRTLHPKCDICKFYHPKLSPCPASDIAYKYTKWRHSKGFVGSSNLFNFWHAKEYIKDTAILVESSGNVLRLEEAEIPISLGIFGANFTPAQSNKLINLGVKNLILLLDNDEAGKKASNRIMKKYYRDFKIKSLIDKYGNFNDIGEMPKDFVKDMMKGYV